MRGRLEPPPKRESGLVEVYVEITRLIERLHRRFLDVIRYELKRLGIDDI